MKKNCFVLTALAAFVSLALSAQTLLPIPKTAYLDSYKLEITYNKTSNLVFPSPIASIDRGSPDIIAQKAGGAENILRVKAGIKGFEETNLSVITGDGKLYSFLVCYAAQPPYLSVNLTLPEKAFLPQAGTTPDVSTPVDAKGLHGLSERALHQQSNVRVRTKRAKMEAVLEGLYVKENLLFFRLQLHNHSSIGYDLEGLRFSIRDSKVAKRTASQEVEVPPVLITGGEGGVNGKGKASLVAVLPKQTLPDGQYLHIDVAERGGGRHLSLKVKDRLLLKAKLLSL
jgi:conjugative transposon TraN protein